MSRPLPTLTLYTRPGCHLCEQAAEQLERLEFAFTELDVDTHPEWRQKYSDDVPVLALDGRVLLKGVLSRGRLSVLKLRLLREMA